jgi:hypothetical protein
MYRRIFLPHVHEMAQITCHFWQVGFELHARFLAYKTECHIQGKNAHVSNKIKKMQKN